MVGRQNAVAPRRERQQKTIAFSRQDQREVVILVAVRLPRGTERNPLPPPVGGEFVRGRRLVPAGAVAGLPVNDFDLDFRIAKTREPFRRARTASTAIDD